MKFVVCFPIALNRRGAQLQMFDSTLKNPVRGEALLYGGRNVVWESRVQYRPNGDTVRRFSRGPKKQPTGECNDPDIAPYVRPGPQRATLGTLSTAVRSPRVQVLTILPDPASDRGPISVFLRY